MVIIIQEKILEHYWGEHIHLGYYSSDVQKKVRRWGFWEELLLWVYLEVALERPVRIRKE